MMMMKMMMMMTMMMIAITLILMFSFQALIEVAAYRGWMRTLLLTMRLYQSVIRATWPSQSSLPTTFYWHEIDIDDAVDDDDDDNDDDSHNTDINVLLPGPDWGCCLPRLDEDFAPHNEAIPVPHPGKMALSVLSPHHFLPAWNWYWWCCRWWWWWQWWW